LSLFTGYYESLLVAIPAAGGTGGQVLVQGSVGQVLVANLPSRV